MIARQGRSVGRFTYIVFAFLLSFVHFSCTRDDVPQPDGGDGEALVRLTIRTPGVSVPRNGVTRSGGDPEYDITNIKVVVLTRGGDGRYYYSYMTDGQDVTPQDGQRTTFYALLKGTDNPVKLLMTANHGDAFNSLSLDPTYSEEDVRRSIVSSFSYSDGMYLPMYGEVSLDRLDTSTVSTISAVMLRAVARADVRTDLDPQLSKTFEITEAFIYRAHGSVQLAPDAGALSGSSTPKVHTPSIPATAGTIPRYSKTTLDPTRIEGLYLPEGKAVSDPSQQLMGVACIVVGGFFDGESTPVYYRIDFNSGAEGHPYGQVLRNHRYDFVIKKVTGRGWEDPDEAANNRSTSIVAEIREWEDFTLEMHVGGDDYFGVSSRELVFTYKAGESRMLYVQSTVDYSMTWLDDNGQPVGEKVSSAGQKITNGIFSAEIVREPGFASDESRIVYTTLSENRTQADRRSRMLVEWGGWKFYITLIQQSYVSNSREVIKVLSAFYGTAGHLGFSDSPASADGRPMRYILSNPDNFSVRGTVNYFAGFTFNCTYNVHAFQDPDGYNDATETLRALLLATDVLYLGNDNRISATAARMVMEWLEADRHRVLIVGADSPGTSHNLLRDDRDYTGLLVSDVDYWYGSTWFQTYHYDNLGIGTSKARMPSAYTDQNADFTRGPFGNINLGETCSITDVYYGYAKTYKSSIVPLIVHSDYPGYMLIGVDKERRIVYHGDASLFQHSANRMSSGAYNYGTINNTLDLLWANTWAWIAHQVIWGDSAGN